MRRLDRYEREILGSYEKGALVSVRPTKAQLAALRDAARAILHKYVSERLQEKRSRLTARAARTRARAARAG